MDIVIEEYLDEGKKSPFKKWFDSLPAMAAVKIAKALYQIERGNFSNTKSLGGGIHEYKLVFGPGYRIYFGKRGNTLVILLGGGTKKRQSKDIEIAKSRWKDFKSRIKNLH